MHRTLFAGGLWLLSAMPLASQTPGPVAIEGPRQAVFETLKDSQWVRLSGPGIGRQEGRLLERGPSKVVLSPGPQPIRVATTSIDTLWTRGTSVKTGAIAGALFGAALGVGVGVLCGEHGDDCNTGGAVALFGGVGLAGGGLLGTLFGLAIPKWHRRYP